MPVVRNTHTREKMTGEEGRIWPPLMSKLNETIQSLNRRANPCLTPIGWLLSKPRPDRDRQKTTRDGNGAEELEPSGTARGHSSRCAKQDGSFLRIQNRTTIDPAIPLLDVYLELKAGSQKGICTTMFVAA